MLQFDCSDIDSGGPVGCLQYYSGAVGLVASFNYPIGAMATVLAADGTAMTHLANQRYSVCFRRMNNMCGICFRTNILTVGAGTQSFGLSVSATAQMNAVDGACTSDYLEIPQSVATGADAILRTMLGVQKICGSQFVSTAAAAAGALTTSVCTGSVPFRIGVVTDGNEAWVNAGDGTNSDDINNGIIGFALNFEQIACA